ncbi:hypothetical protein SAMN06265371_10182 [Lutibacter agarilyticus]|uniref:Uncharacterized protein n=1 Tax=Lutibacter agarilyticus TaxID=1109740 RepID=A0A238V9R8_9FLAO|nr:hypothetical protein SAMN06265371_10182 [Lutibacter agarilyticus]
MAFLLILNVNNLEIHVNYFGLYILIQSIVNV